MREEHFGVGSSQDRLGYAVVTHQSPHLSSLAKKKDLICIHSMHPTWVSYMGLQQKGLLQLLRSTEGHHLVLLPQKHGFQKHVFRNMVSRVSEREKERIERSHGSSGP